MWYNVIVQYHIVKTSLINRHTQHVYPTRGETMLDLVLSSDSDLVSKDRMGQKNRIIF